ncbi:MAG: metalloregulator ArsR/SmtB family transcription factor [Saccharofermentans sp.]|nr:metalloregulator ArsR/SmtB family transcription factor [Saccharofermentans sp.]
MASINVKGIRRLSALSEPMRLDILTVIASSGSCCASDILSNFNITQPTLSHHMSVLIENNLVTAKKDGRFVRYTINKSGIEDLKFILDMLIEGTPATEISSTEEPSEEKETKKKKKPEKKKKDKKMKK